MPINRREFLKLAGLAVGGTLLGTENVLASADTSKRVGMLYDATQCVGCNACTNGCREWNKTPIEKDPSSRYDAPKELSAKTWTLIQLYKGENEYSFVKRQCMHCISPACVSACPVHALRQLENGPVVYDPSRCIGCRYCMYACPFHVPRFTWDKTIPVIAKCTLCFDRINSGQGGPRCAEYCPTGALIWGQRDKLLTEAKGRLAATPNRYHDHVYGENEAGGTSVLYLASVPYEKLGLPKLGNEPIPELSERVGGITLPGILLGVPLALLGVRYIAKEQGWMEE
jgi:formate dehydrogenase beta subunit